MILDQGRTGGNAISPTGGAGDMAGALSVATPRHHSVRGSRALGRPRGSLQRLPRTLAGTSDAAAEYGGPITPHAPQRHGQSSGIASLCNKPRGL